MHTNVISANLQVEVVFFLRQLFRRLNSLANITESIHLNCCTRLHVQYLDIATDMSTERVGESSDSLSRRRPNFSTRTAQEDGFRLAPGDSAHSTSDERTRLLPWPPTRWARPYEPVNSTEPTTPENQDRRNTAPTDYFHGITKWWRKHLGADEEEETNGDSTSQHVSLSAGPLRDSSADKKDKSGHRSKSLDEPKKLGTFSGVFVPTTLNVLSILMFLRFGFILGQAGVLGILGEHAFSCIFDWV